MEPAQAARLRIIRTQPMCDGSEAPSLSFFAPDPERFLGRAVGNREQHGFLGGPVGGALPWRHDKDVIRSPFEDRTVDLGRTAALETDEDRAVGRLVGLAIKSL